MPAPANNLFASRTVINPAALPYSLTSIDNTACTEEVGAPLFVVQGDGTLAGAAAGFKHLWWEITPTVSQNYQFLCSSTSPNFGIFTGTALGALTEYASWAGRLTIYLEAGTAYQICVISWNGSASPTFDVSLTATPTAPLQQLQTLREPAAFPISVEVDGSLMTDTFVGPVSANQRLAGYKLVFTEDTYLSFWIHKGTGATTINPWVWVYSDANWNIFDWPDTWPDSFNYNSINYPVIVAFPAGTYYFYANYFNATPVSQNIKIDVEQWEQPAEIPSGAILIQDDRGYLPAAALDPDTFEFLGFVPGVPSGEYWFTDSASGKTLMENPFGSTDFYPYDGDAEGFTLFDADWTKLWSFPHSASFAPSGAPITGVGNGKFYIANLTPHPSSGHVNVNRMDVSAPVLEGAAWDVTMESALNVINGMAISPDESTLYFTEIGTVSGTVTKKVRQWDMNTDSALSDLATSATHYPTRELLALEDGSILVAWYKSDNTSFIRRYDAAGATLNTYNMFDATSSEIRMWQDADPDNFWVFIKKASEVSQFFKIRASDGTVLTTSPDIPWFESGLLGSADSVTPAARFGHSFSCGGITTRAAIALSPEVWEPPTPDTPSEPCCPCDCPPEKGPGGSPSSAPLEAHTGPILPAVLADWTPNCTGGGTVPTAADATDAESWIS